MALHVNGLKLAESKRTSYQVLLGPNDEPEHLLAPDWWKHVSRTLRKGDRIEVLGYEGTWFAEALVLQVGVEGAGGARVMYIISPISMEDQDLPEIVGHIIKWAGPIAKWRIARAKDNEVVKDGFDSRDAAHAFLTKQNLALAA